jgi:hypothetical protein
MFHVTKCEVGNNLEGYDLFGSRDGSVGVGTGYGLDGRSSLAVAGDFSLLHSFKTASEAHPASYPVDIRDSFPGGKVVRA